MKESYLIHHGVKGQKWGVRRYQNEDGSLTEKGIKRYSGKHGAAKYVRDTHPTFRKLDKDLKTMDRVMIPTVATLTALQNYSNYEDIKQAGAVFSASILGGIIGSKLGDITGNAINYRQIEKYPQWQNDLNNARRYLRSQGINVEKPATTNNINTSQVAINAGETFRQQQLMFDRQQRMGF